MTFDLNIEKGEVLLLTSQFLLKGYKMLSFHFAFFPRFQTLWKLISREQKQISTNGISFFLVFNSLSYQPIKKLSKISMHRHFNYIDQQFLLLQSHKIKIAEAGQLEVSIRALHCKYTFFIISENADRIDYGEGVIKRVWE